MTKINSTIEKLSAERLRNGMYVSIFSMQSSETLRVLPI